MQCHPDRIKDEEDFFFQKEKSKSNNLILHSLTPDNEHFGCWVGTDRDYTLSFSPYLLAVGYDGKFKAKSLDLRK